MNAMSPSSDGNENQRPEGRRSRFLRRLQTVWPAAAGACFGIALRLLYFGAPQQRYNAMASSFVLLVPIVVAAVSVYMAELSQRRSWFYYFKVGALANVLFVLGTFLILIEGIICVILAAPLFALLGGIGGLAAGAVFRSVRWPRRTMYGVAALPIVLGALEPLRSLPNEVETVSRTVTIAAPAHQVWQQLLTTRQIASGEIDNAWMYRIGVPPPLSAETELLDGALVRHIVMGRAIHFDQVSNDWTPDRRVRWTYRFEKDSIPAGALDDHVKIGGEYFDLIDTEYSISDAPGGTQLRVEMRYRVSTNFNWYAAPVARLLVGDFESAALAFYAHRATTPPGR
jgi:hypothetical protein